MSKWLDWQPSDPQIMTDSPESEPTKPTEPTFDSFGSAHSRENPIIQPTGQGETGDQIIEKAPSSEPTKPTEPTPNPEPVEKLAEASVEHSRPAEGAAYSSFPAKPCGVCHSRRFWVSVHSVTTCATCHPPASPRLVRQWIDLSDPEMLKQPESSGEMSNDCPFRLPEGVTLVGYEKKEPPVAITTFSIVNDPEKFIRHALAELDARLHQPLQIRAGDSTFTLLSKLEDCGLALRLGWAPDGHERNAQEAQN